jgi:hypothetical protein
MRRLQRLEREFQDYVYRGRGGMVRRVAAADPSRARERLAIYADAYRLRLLEVLADDYPGLKAMAGQRKFRRLAQAYIESHPSTHFNARWYGRHLADFLRTSAPWPTQPALAEMAALEWAMTLVFDAPDDAVASVDAAAAIPPRHWGHLRPALHRAVALVPLSWTVAEIRKAVDRGTPLPRARRLRAPRTWLVWRKDLTVYYRPAAVDEARALDAAGRGATFAQICDGLAAHMAPARVALRAAVLLRRWLEAGLIHDLGQPAGGKAARRPAFSFHD